METTKTPPRNHTEQGVIDALRDAGYIETTDENGTWFTSSGEQLIDRQIDLHIIENICIQIDRNTQKLLYDVQNNLNLFEDLGAKLHKHIRTPVADEAAETKFLREMRMAEEQERKRRDVLLRLSNIVAWVSIAISVCLLLMILLK